YGFVLQSMKEMAHKKLELSMLYGQLGIGKVQSVSGNVVTITADTWSPGTWAGLINAGVDSWTGTGATATAHDTNPQVLGINLANRQITFSTITNTVANDFLYF